MKKNKLFALLLTSALATSVMVGCAEKTETPDGEDKTPPVETPVETPVEKEEEQSKIAKVGLGVYTDISQSTNMVVMGNPYARIETTFAAVALDEDDKIVSVTLDSLDTKINFNNIMEIETDLNAELKTKKELGADYGMKMASGIGVEWFKQIEALEEWMIGKTLEEVAAMKTVENEMLNTIIDEEDLKSSVTINARGHLAAVQKAIVNAVDAEGATIGLGSNTSIAKSKAQADGKGAVGQADTTIAVTVLDKDGKVVKTIIDTAQTKVQYNLEGEVESSFTDLPKTKKELGDDYGMKGASAIGKEWFEQIAALEDWTVGKTPDEVAGIAIVESIPTDEDLKSSVSIKIDGYLDAFKEASEKAK